jgi:hypothetical protein
MLYEAPNQDLILSEEDIDVSPEVVDLWTRILGYNSGKPHFINFIPEKPLLTDEVSYLRHSPGGRPESRLSERCSFTASLHMAATLFVADELAKCVSESDQIRLILGSSPTLMNRKQSELDFGSTAYNNVIENLCYCLIIAICKNKSLG